MGGGGCENLQRRVFFTLVDHRTRGLPETHRRARLENAMLIRPTVHLQRHCFGTYDRQAKPSQAKPSQAQRACAG